MNRFRYVVFYECQREQAQARRSQQFFENSSRETLVSAIYTNSSQVVCYQQHTLWSD